MSFVRDARLILLNKTNSFMCAGCNPRLVMQEGDTTRVNPEVPQQVVDDLKVAVRAFNDGKIKGRFSPAITEAMQLYIACLFATDPDKLRNLESALDVDDVKEIDDPDEYRDRVIKVVDGVAQTIDQAAQQTHREQPGGPTRFEQYLRNAETLDADDGSGDGEGRQTMTLDSRLVKSSE